MAPTLARLAAGAVLRLPEGHPVRDEARIKAALLKILEGSGISGAEGNTVNGANARQFAFVRR